MLFIPILKKIMKKYKVSIKYNDIMSLLQTTDTTKINEILDRNKDNLKLLYKIGKEISKNPLLPPQFKIPLQILLKQLKIKYGIKKKYIKYKTKYIELKQKIANGEYTLID